MSDMFDDLRRELGEPGVPWERACRRGSASRAPGAGGTGRSGSRGPTGTGSAARFAQRPPSAPMSALRYDSWTWRERWPIGIVAGVGALIGAGNIAAVRGMLAESGAHDGFVENVLCWPVPYVQGALALVVGLGLLLAGLAGGWFRRGSEATDWTVRGALGLLILTAAPSIVVLAGMLLAAALFIVVIGWLFWAVMVA